jgi:chaperonin GroES
MKIDSTKIGIIPTGGHVLVLPDKVEEKTSGGIIIPDTVRDKSQAAATSGIVISIGPTAWKDIDAGESWAVVGDHVTYAKYAGVIMKGNDGIDYTLINDNDILAVLSF